MIFGSEQSDTLEQILRWRRDVRHFDPRPIAPDTMQRLRARMELSPSVGNARPWRVLRVTCPDLRDAVADIFQRANAQAAQGYDDDTQQEYQQLKLAGLRESPEHLAVFTETDPDEGRGLGRRTMPETLMMSSSMAIYTLWLAARAENIGLGWVSILDPQAVTALFDVPDSWLFTGYLCLGHAQFSDDTPLLHRAGWQENTVPDWAEAKAAGAVK